MRYAQVVILSGVHRWFPTFFGLLGVCFLLSGTTAYGTAPPNIVLIVIDDQGWTDSSVLMDPRLPNSKSTYYQTPNLQALANSGMRFSNGYSSAPQCAQTRAALLTGKSPAQLQMTDLVYFQTGSAKEFPIQGPIPEPFDPTQMTLPRLVKQANPDYRAGLIGKWHLDVPATTLPLAAGFDTWEFAGLSDSDPMGANNVAVTANAYMQSAVNANKPFFLDVSYHAVHEQYNALGQGYLPAKPELVEKYKNLPKGIHFVPEYAAALEDLDNSIGLVMNKIDELGIADNTYVFYVSDNGGSGRYTNAVPLQAGKSGIRDGGIRVPFMVRGPGIESGVFSDVAVSTTDLMSTITSLIGYEGPAPAGNEGGDISPVLFNGGDLPAGMPYIDRPLSVRGELYFHYPHVAGNGPRLAYRPASAVRDGDFKLYVEYDETGGPNRVSLHNMITDPYESTNLASSMPQYTAELTSMLDNYLAAVDASMPYDIKTPVHLRWDASAPGVDPKGWRSTIDVNYKGRETWSLGAGAEQPTAVNMAAFQPGLPDRAFAFDGGDIMRHVFFNVGDKLPRYLGITNMTMGTADFDRSASLSTWFRTSALNRNQVLFESGDGSSGMSLTLGNADGNGGFNDLRLRVRSADGTAYDVTAPIDKFANPTADFVNATAVINDSTTNRYLELYINGAVAARLDLPTGDASSINWDGFDQAGLGRAANGLGGAAGSGNLPFNGGFVGQMAAVSFYNYALNQSTVAGNYNAMLDPVGLGVQARTGEIVVPTARATDLRLGAAESDSLLVMEERRGVTAAPLSVSAIVAEGVSSHYAAPSAPQQLASGAEFTSYLMHFDPLANTPGLQTVTGSVTFAEEILAIVYDGGLLSASDAALGAIGNYGTTGDRGLAWSPGDFLSVDANQRTLSFNLTIAGDELLQFRVLTGAVSPAGGADFNNDGIVDGADLAAWTAAYGASPNADADGDGDSDGSDFLQWQRDLGAGSSTTAAAAVPEPAAMAMLAVAAFAGAAVARRRRS